MNIFIFSRSSHDKNLSEEREKLTAFTASHQAMVSDVSDMKEMKNVCLRRQDCGVGSVVMSVCTKVNYFLLLNYSL